MAPITVPVDGLTSTISIDKPVLETQSSKPIFFQFPIKVMPADLREILIRHAVPQAKQPSGRLNPIIDGMDLIPSFEAVTVSLWYNTAPVVRLTGAYLSFPQGRSKTPFHFSGAGRRS